MKTPPFVAKPAAKKHVALRRCWTLSGLLAALVICVGCASGGGAFFERGGGGGGGNGGGSGNGAPCSPGNPVTTSPSVALGVGQVVPSNFMDLHVGTSDLLDTVTVPYGSLRLWDTETGWAQINTGPGQYSWSNLDGFVDAASGGVDLLYNLGRVPTWASSDPSDSSCGYSDSSEGGPGQCDPPTDLNSDGSGTDQDWINWVTAVAQRNASTYGNKIKYYEIWNEWNINLFWTGSTAQLVRMEQDARCVVEGPPGGQSCNSNSTFPSGTALNTAAKIVSPSPVGAHTDLNQVQLQLQSYFGTKASGSGALGGTFADVIGFHGYVSTPNDTYPCPNPEEVTVVVDDMNNAMPGTPGAGKPWFDTEDSWGKAPDEGFTDADRQAAFLARDFLLQQSMGVARLYWYRWDATSTYGGALWSSAGGATEAATAWEQVSKWMVGNEITAPGCTAKGSVWSCPISNPSGSWNALAVWDASQDCAPNESCTTSNFTVPSGGFTQYLDIAGDPVSSFSGTTVPIGAKPILLETGTLP